MKTSKLLTALIASAILTLSAAAATSNTYDNAVAAAKDLYMAGLMKGTSDTFSEEALELNRPATRTEIAITITRLLGKEKKAVYQQNPHPFTDVPEWADAHIGWLYENYLVNGISETVFGSEDTATTRQFCTMLLRVLGYSDSKGDFSYSNATEFAFKIGLINKEQAKNEILYRSDMALISRTALGLPLKNAYRTLSQKLREDRSITKEQFVILNPVQRSALDIFFEAYPKKVSAGRAYYDNNKIVIEMEKNVGDYGLRVFYTSNSNLTPIELPIENNTFGFTKSSKVSPFKWYEKVTVFNIHGLDGELGLQFAVVDSSSEGTLYKINNVSPVIETKYKHEWENYKVSLEEFFSEQSVKLPGGDIIREKETITVIPESPITSYGIRVVYISDQTTYPTELPLGNTEKGFTKGEPDWSIGGKMHEVHLHGISEETNIRVCIVETSSEGEIYKTRGISPVISEK